MVLHLFLRPFLPVGFRMEALVEEVHEGSNLGREVLSMGVDRMDFQGCRNILSQHGLKPILADILTDHVGREYDETQAAEGCDSERIGDIRLKGP